MTKGMVIWFTGLPCSGKTTIAKEVQSRLAQLNLERLDGDTIRKTLTADLGFSKEDRRKNLERVAFVAQLLERNNIIVLCSFVSPHKETRQWIKSQMQDYREVFVKCSVDECERRDVKGMYAQARQGIIQDFTGVDDPYEEPLDPVLIVDTERESVDQSVEKVMQLILGKREYDDTPI